MTETGTGWPEAERDAYDTHANVKLTAEQLAYIEESRESISQWIRSAVQSRIQLERATTPPSKKAEQRMRIRIRELQQAALARAQRETLARRMKAQTDALTDQQ